ncbi:hypothetical protein FR932_00125 (plasmid) [Moritella marina ATCC 15381]|uniref:Uncharacterized protein n=1 Tax=Moritella marina ATCC 15381 TaxID=1202962 RepID=A0A5J6WIW7_MORMI|nr:hypothetical protein [Moritella marina]QFI36332.1 hypothetical protein FR932_00125 [Moritella marina ATCC 15381]
MDPILSGLLGVLVGAILGHRLSLGRDRRKEFNQATELLRKNSIIQLDSMEDDYIGTKRVTEDEIQTLRSIIGDKRSKKIAYAFKLYTQSHKNYSQSQPPSNPINPQPINISKIPECKLALKKLIKSLEPL